MRRLRGPLCLPWQVGVSSSFRKVNTSTHERVKISGFLARFNADDSLPYRGKKEEIC